MVHKKSILAMACSIVVTFSFVSMPSRAHAIVIIDTDYRDGPEFFSLNLHSSQGVKEDFSLPLFRGSFIWGISFTVSESNHNFKFGGGGAGIHLYDQVRIEGRVSNTARQIGGPPPPLPFSFVVNADNAPGGVASDRKSLGQLGGGSGRAGPWSVQGALVANTSHIGFFGFSIDDITSYRWTLTGNRVEASPEPSSLIALGSGLVGLVVWRRRRQQIQKATN